MRRELDPERAGSDPTKTFVVIASVIVALGTVVWLTRPDPDTVSTADTAAAQRTPDFLLTDEEAIARFKELDRIRVTAIDDGDLSLLSDVFAEGSAILRVTEKSIVRLNRSGVRAIHDPYRVEKIEIVRNQADAISLRQTVIFDVRFVDRLGKDLTRQSGLERQTIVWSLAPAGDSWLIGAARVTDSDRL